MRHVSWDCSHPAKKIDDLIPVNLVGGVEIDLFFSEKERDPRINNLKLIRWSIRNPLRASESISTDAINFFNLQILFLFIDIVKYI